MTRFDHPPPSALARVLGFRGGLLPPVLDVGHIALRGQRGPGRGVVIPLIRAEVLGVAGHGPGARDDGRLEDRGEPEVIIHVRPADDEGERDASPVHQEVALGAFFSPGRSDSGRWLRRRGGLSS